MITSSQFSHVLRMYSSFSLICSETFIRQPPSITECRRQLRFQRCLTEAASIRDRPVGLPVHAGLPIRCSGFGTCRHARRLAAVRGFHNKKRHLMMSLLASANLMVLFTFFHSDHKSSLIYRPAAVSYTHLDVYKRQSGRFLMISRATVKPPTPESNTPMGAFFSEFIFSSPYPLTNRFATSL